MEDIRMAALLHDVGKIDVNLEVLGKADDLTEEEWTEVKTHATSGAELVEEFGSILGNVVPLIRYHHEQYGGDGYFNLRETEIPLGARIIAVADAFDAMTSERPYQPRIAPDKALATIRENAGRQFDPGVVAALTRVNPPADWTAAEISKAG